jgi:hypothetical protein
VINIQLGKRKKLHEKNDLVIELMGENDTKNRKVIGKEEKDGGAHAADPEKSPSLPEANATGDGDDNHQNKRRLSSSRSERRMHHRKNKRSKRHDRDDTDSATDDDDDDDSSSSSDEKDRKRRRKKQNPKKKKRKKRSRRKYESESSSSSSSSRSSDSNSSSSSSSSDVDDGKRRRKKKKWEQAEASGVVRNERLLAKLSARGETIEERKARRAHKRAALITAKLGYTAEDNPFHDPNLHETFTWKKRDEKRKTAVAGPSQKTLTNKDTLLEIEKVRKRRLDRELQFEEMERIRAEESRMKELENYDEWARKEEEFHLQQQRQRSAIRLVEGREKPIDILAKNILMFGLSEDEKKNRASVKYQERYNAMEAMESLEAELEDSPTLLKMLKLKELEELLVDIDAFRQLEREALAYAAAMDGKMMVEDSVILRYWDNLRIVAEDEIQFLKSGGKKGQHASMAKDVQSIFEGQSLADLRTMKTEIQDKLRRHAADANTFGDEEFDRNYWKFVLEQLQVHISKMELSELHGKMLVRQLEKLEKKRDELARAPEAREKAVTQEIGGTGELSQQQEEKKNPALPENVDANFGDLEEELGLADEMDVQAKNYSWQDKYRPRKPRYFNRVKTGYDWNKYNQTHYDKDNPPPKIVQGYKFNIFYPDLIDPTKTPSYVLEPADSDDFCIIRFKSPGPPYEDIAFKIINREWNRSRKRGFKSTFERGVLSLYFNFTTHWYRK